MTTLTFHPIPKTTADIPDNITHAVLRIKGRNVYIRDTHKSYTSNLMHAYISLPTNYSPDKHSTSDQLIFVHRVIKLMINMFASDSKWQDIRNFDQFEIAYLNREGVSASAKATRDFETEQFVKLCKKRFGEDFGVGSIIYNPSGYKNPNKDSGDANTWALPVEVSSFSGTVVRVKSIGSIHRCVPPIYHPSSGHKVHSSIPFFSQIPKTTLVTKYAIAPQEIKDLTGYNIEVQASKSIWNPRTHRVSKPVASGFNYTPIHTIPIKSHAQICESVHEAFDWIKQNFPAQSMDFTPDSLLMMRINEIYISSNGLFHFKIKVKPARL